MTAREPCSPNSLNRPASGMADLLVRPPAGAGAVRVGARRGAVPIADGTRLCAERVHGVTGEVAGACAFRGAPESPRRAAAPARRVGPGRPGESGLPAPSVTDSDCLDAE